MGELLRRGYRVLIGAAGAGPFLSALPPFQRQAKADREFVAQGGTLIADGQPGAFDEHCRRLPKPHLPIEDIEDGCAHLPSGSVVGKEGAVHRKMGELLQAAGVKREFAVTDGSVWRCIRFATAVSESWHC